MPIVEFRGQNFEIADDPARDVYFILGIRKCGSSIFNSMLSELARFNGVRFIDIGSRMFENGIPALEWSTDPELSKLARRGNVLGGFRTFPAGLSASIPYKTGRKVLMVRDPRDALVSEFFSNAYSHTLPDRGEMREKFTAFRDSALTKGLVEYIETRIVPMRRTMGMFLPCLSDPSVRIFRYEDYILNKGALLEEASSHFGWEISDELRDAILGWADVVPDVEDPKKFVRRVIPGDHKNKMPIDLIDRVNAEMAEIMDAFGYE